MTASEIEKLMEWGPPELINTVRGERIRRKGKDSPAFAEFYYKANLYPLGITRKQQPNGKYEVCWWQEVPKELIENRQKSVAESLATDADIDIPVPSGLAYLPYQKAGIAFAIKKFGDWK